MSQAGKASEEQVFSTVCPRNCYSTCSLNVRVKGGRITGIDPHPGNRATPEGGCIKGLAYVERAHSPERILYPLRRNQNGTFSRITWDEALDKIAQRLKEYHDTGRQHSVLFFASSGMSGLLNGISTAFWRLYGGATTTYGNLCWPAGLEATRLTLGANNHNAPWDLENARLVILWGKNPAETNIQEMLHISRAQEKGARLVVIDPRRTPSADRADRLFQLKPGTDGALALAIARILIKENLCNKDFIDKHVLGYEAFADSLEAFTPEAASSICRIPAEAIRELALWIGETHAMTMIPGYGLQRYPNGGQTIRCLLALSVITGQIGRPGACWHYANLQSYIFDDIKEPVCYYPGTEAACFRRKVSVARPGKDMMVLSEPAIRFIWVERANPLTQNPDSNLNLEAFRKAEFRVVVEQFMTDTAIEADIILPAKNMFEQSDLVGSYWNPYVQLRQKILEPAGEVKPETEIYYLLAQRLGFEQERILENIPEPTDEAIESWLKGYLSAFPELSWEALKEGPQLAAQFEEIPFSNGRFPTPSGKIELYSEEAARLWGVSPLPAFVPLAPPPPEYPLQLVSPNSKNRIHSQFGNLEAIRQFEPEARLMMHPTDAKDRHMTDGECVCAYNQNGHTNVKISLDAGLRRGCVVLTNGHWHRFGASPNLFTTGTETDMGHGTSFHNTWIEVRKRGEYV